MATPFSEIHEIALSKITDYNILNFAVEDREDIFNSYLLSAQVYFQKKCKVDLTDKDVNLKQYNNDLDDEIKEILATGEIYYWLLPKVNNTELLKNNLSNKDFSVFSNANLLKELVSLKNNLFNEFNQKIIKYTYDNASLSDLKV